VSLGPPVVSLLVKAGHMTLFFVIAGISLVAMILLLVMVKPESKEGKGGLSEALRPQH